MHGGPSPSSSDSEKCLKEKEQLIHLLREFQAKTQCKESPGFDAAVRFLIGATYLLIFAAIFMLMVEQGTQDGQLAAT
uniref:Uncharacterized protein n=2 Tax=Setaria TaxID=4554 RepID=K4AHI4_SETIT